MADRPRIDVRDAVNAISDVVQNRPRPIRSFDQIYMKAGDMVMQSELVADWADGKQIAFIGDGDAISVCVAYFKKRNIIDYGPSRITVFDFDERIVHAIKRFAEREQIRWLDAELYNCIEAFPRPSRFDCFYTNPPWGQSNNGSSVHVFVRRGIEACGFQGQGMVVIGDDKELEWPKQVLATTQRYGADLGYFVSRMQPQMHQYHLDDDKLLRSCNLFFEALPGNQSHGESATIIDPQALRNFYGRDQGVRVRYVRDKRPNDAEGAHPSEYELTFYEAGQ